jgi:hypothetical protein
VKRPIWLTAVCGGGLILGCGPVRPPYPDDPLLLAKKPVAGKAAASEPVRLASAEPAPPELSPTEMASALPPPQTPVQALSAPPPDRARRPIQAIPTSNRHSSDP